MSDDARSLYTDSARQDLGRWLAFPGLARAVVIAAIKGHGPQEWRCETLSFAPTDEWPSVEEDCALLKKAVEAIEHSGTIVDDNLTRLVDRTFAPGWMMVVCLLADTIYNSCRRRGDEISIIVSSIPEGCGIETFDEQPYRQMLEAGIDTLQNPAGQIAPGQ